MTEHIFWQPRSNIAPIAEGQVDVWVVDLQCPAVELNSLLALLSNDEMYRAARFHFAIHRKRFIVARACLRQILSYYLQIPPKSIQFAYAKHGKPFLAHHPQGLYFNMSHSEDLALYGVTYSSEVGIDVEFIKEDIDAEAIATRFFSTAEIKVLKNLPEAQKILAFYNCWTRKEAFIKAIGEGLSCPLDSFSVTLAPEEEARMICIGNDQHRAKEWSLLALKPAANFAATLAIKGTVNSVHASSWQLK